MLASVRCRWEVVIELSGDTPEGDPARTGCGANLSCAKKRRRAGATAGDREGPGVDCKSVAADDSAAARMVSAAEM